MIRSILGAVVALLAAAAPAGAADGRYVLAVNAGSNSVSSLAVDADGLELRDVEASGGIRPTSVAERNGLVYVLNPSQIAIAPDSDALVVTERATNSIMTWELDGDVPGALSYRLDGASVQTVSPLVPSMRAAACWAVVTKDGRFAYLTNGGTGDATALRIDQDGSISLRTPSGVDATVGGSAVDAALSENSRFLYGARQSRRRGGDSERLPLRGAAAARLGRAGACRRGGVRAAGRRQLVKADAAGAEATRRRRTIAPPPRDGDAEQADQGLVLRG